MAAYFWVTGGTGNWNSTTNWSATSGGASGASVPGSGDTATLDGNSGSGSVTLDISPVIQTLTCTGFTGTLAFGTNTISLNSTGTIFTGATTMTVTGTPLIICTNSGSSNRTINPGLVSEANAISFRITAGTGTVTFTSGNSNVLNLDFTDGINPTGYAGALANMNPTIYGNLKASTGMTKTAGTGIMTFGATSGVKTINTAGVTFDNPFTFNGVGGTFQLVAALTSGATRTCTLTNGTLDLNGYTLTTGGFSSTNSNTRTLAFGSTGKIVATTNNGTVCVTSTATGLTVTGSKRVELNYSGSVGTRTISGALTATVIEGVNLLNYYITAGTDTIVFTASRSYGDVDFSNGGTSTFAGSLSAVTNTTAIYGNLILNSAMSLGSGTDAVQMKATSGTKTITSAGKTLDFPLTFDGIGGTWSCTDALTLGSTRTLTLTNGTLDLASYTLTTGLFNSNNSNTRVLAFGTGKIVLTGTGATIFSLATGTGFTYTGTSRIEAPGPSTTGTRVFNPSTTTTSTEATALNFYITGGSDTVNFSASSRRVNNMDFTGFTGTFSNSQQTIHGSYTISTGMTVGAGTEVTTFAATTAQTITTNGKTLDFPVTFDGIGGTWTMQDALTLGSTRTLTMTNGTLKLKNGVTSTVGAFATSGTNQKFLQSSTPGSQATLSQATGTVSVSYLTIQDSAATGGATWLAYLANSNVDAGNNTGWAFFANVYTRTVVDSATVTDSTNVAATFNAAIADTAALSDSTSSAFLWNLIDDAQTPNWQNINNDQLPGWQDINTL